jgi:hypothetical protein
VDLKRISLFEAGDGGTIVTSGWRTAVAAVCEGVGTLLSSIIPECKEVTKEDEVGRNEDDETISRKS